jgi:acetyltransferase-like isoleucine patch superfamily enzyme
MNNPFDPGYYSSEELRQMGFAAVGENVLIARNCTIIGLHNIEIGDNVRIDGFTTMVAVGGRLRIGNFIHIGGGCHFVAADDLTFGDFGGASQGVRIYTVSDDFTGRALMGCVPPQFRSVRKAPIHIGRYGVIGSGSVVLPGASIGEGSVVGALSLVTKPLGEWGVYFGCPAKRLKNRSKGLLGMEATLRSEFNGAYDATAMGT